MIYRNLMLYNFSILPASTVVNNAVLTLHIASQVNLSLTKTFSIHKVIENWSTFPIYSRLCPLYDPVPAAQFTVGSGTTQVSINLTALISEWVQDPQRNFGMLFKAEDEAIPNTGVRAYCTGARDSELWPGLDVMFSDITVSVDVQPEFVQETESGLTTQDSNQYSIPRELGTAYFSSFYVRNTGSNNALVQLQVSGDGINYIDDGLLITIAPGNQEILVPQYFGDLARVAYRSETVGQSTTLEIIYVAKLI